MSAGFDQNDAVNGVRPRTPQGESSAAPPCGDCQAVIEIGTNSVKLLVARVAGRQVVRVYGASVVTRLGQGLAKSRRLRGQAIDHTARVVADFADEARKFEPARLRVIATCAGREAANQLELFDAVAQGRPLEVISGEQEAEWAFRGVLSDPALRHLELMLVDLGGGSTEIIVGEEAHIHLRGSYPIGCLRLLELINPADPPSAEDLRCCQAWLAEHLERNLAPQLEPVLHSRSGRKIEMVSVGGTASVIAALCGTGSGPAEGDGPARTVDLVRLDEWVERLWSLSLADRRKLRGVPTERADTVLTGSVALQQIMRRFGFHQFRYSARGVRYGALLDSWGAFGASPGPQAAAQPLRAANH